MYVILSYCHFKANSVINDVAYVKLMEKKTTKKIKGKMNRGKVVRQNDSVSNKRRLCNPT